MRHSKHVVKQKAVLKKVMTRYFGTMKVDTVLNRETVVPGEELSGEVHLKSVSSLKKVDIIVLSIMQQFMVREDRFDNLPLKTIEIQLTEEQKQEKQVQIPFSFELPAHTPHTSKRYKCWLQTDVNVPNKVDPRDMDGLHVTQHPYVQTVDRVFTEVLQFQNTQRNEVIYYIHLDNNKYDKTWLYGPTPSHIQNQVERHPLYPLLSKRDVPFVQEFEYRPSPHFAEKYKEVELVYDFTDDGVDIYAELQFLPRGELSKEEYFRMKALDRDEVIHCMSFTHEEIDNEELIAERFLKLLEGAEPPEELR
ncbi:sporulation protein [Bacillus tianshenii]|nr:sporulation protein [Bacillus tianshenii]